MGFRLYMCILILLKYSMQLLPESLGLVSALCVYVLVCVPSGYVTVFTGFHTRHAYINFPYSMITGWGVL